MLEITPVHVIGGTLTLLLITIVGWYSGRQIKSSSDFSVGGRKASSAVIAGTIMGTLVGGASTIGTAQLAYKYGLSGWWFTLGGGLACLLLGVFLAKPLRETELETAPELLTRYYGVHAGIASSMFSSIGIFFNIVAQVLSAVALLTAMFNLNPLVAAVISIFFMIVYVFFGGVWGTGLVGIVKLILLYIAVIISGFLAYNFVGGVHGLKASFEPYPWFSLFGRGFSTDLAAGFSMIVGVLSTQTYIQAMYSGRDANESRKGAFISAVMIPPIGIAGILVGLYMRANFPNIDPAKAFPIFIIEYLNPWMGGIVLATLLVAVVGTGAGLTLGISTMLTKDIYKKIIHPQASDKNLLLVSRMLIVVVMGITLLFVSGNLKAIILQWSFMSMGLRGATIFFPLLGAIFLKGRVSPKFGFAAIILGPSTVLLWKIIAPNGINPLFIGLVISMVTVAMGTVVSGKKIQA